MPPFPKEFMTVAPAVPPAEQEKETASNCEKALEDLKKAYSLPEWGPGNTGLPNES